MPLKLTIRLSAQRDITRTLDYIALEADRAAALRYVDRLQRRCEALLPTPGKGMPYGRKPGIRKINEGAYKIDYRVTEAEIIILRLWDGRRGTEPKLPP